ncbi:hypothetical protein [Gemmata sp.]|uniref:hypothetical protein n=1 Tax=Gemmata sp. TaxID=1914242 RepID=UPI003F6F3823
MPGPFDIDPTEFVSLAHALRAEPRTRTVHPATGRRWASRGVKTRSGAVVKLAVQQVGSQLRTRLVDLRGFLDLLNEIASPDTAAATGPRSPSKRRKAGDAAGEQLVRTGW